ncbi:alpha/beta hydrolase [Myxococcota bacterium]|nr:alpha/beta hydrolase [Myxococcota bacterium]
MEPVSHRIDGAHGNRLHVLEWSREGVPMVLLHGHGNDAHLWDDFVPCVAPHYRVLAVDQRGHGDSDWDPQGRYDSDSLASDLEKILEAFAIDRFVLIGFSMGGRASMIFAERHPERLAGLVLVDIAPELDARGRIRIGGEIAENRAPVFRDVEEYARMLTRNYPAGSPDALRRMAKYGLRQRSDGLFELKMDPKLRGDRIEEDPARAGAAEEALSQRMWQALAKLPCPTLVVRGAASDILSPEIADKMVDEVLQKGRLAVVPRAAHSVATDNPKGFEEAVAAFVLG